MYEIWIIAARPYAEKAIGTATSTLVPDCQNSGPGLFFYLEDDATAYWNKIEPELRQYYKIYRATIAVDKTSAVTPESEGS